MCGCRFWPSSRSPAACTRSWIARGPRRRPWRLTNTALSCGALMPRNASHCSRASRALRPTGNTRVLLPLPCTWTRPAGRSSWSVSRLVSSDRRKPEE
ncbi:hypothetical protein D3C72_2059230 [compost metagenome]